VQTIRCHPKRTCERDRPAAREAIRRGEKGFTLKDAPTSLMIVAALTLACRAAPRDARAPAATAHASAEKPVALVEATEAGGCIATGEFNLSPKHDHLAMRVLCPDGRRLRAPRLGGTTPNIFRIPFERAVVSIMGEEDGAVTLHLHYELDGDDIHHIASLPELRGEYTYSFAMFVPHLVKPLPVVNK
jgi:hypothetical protein